MRPETKAGPIWRARREEKVNSLMGSPEPGPPRPPPPAAGGSSCAKAARERPNRRQNSLMDGSITRGTETTREKRMEAFHGDPLHQIVPPGGPGLASRATAPDSDPDCRR